MFDTKMVTALPVSVRRDADDVVTMVFVGKHWVGNVTKNYQGKWYSPSYAVAYFDVFEHAVLFLLQKRGFIEKGDMLSFISPNLD